MKRVNITIAEDDLKAIDYFCGKEGLTRSGLVRLWIHRQFRKDNIDLLVKVDNSLKDGEKLFPQMKEIKVARKDIQNTLTKARGEMKAEDYI